MSGRLRDTLKDLLGERLVDITDEPEETSLEESGHAYIHLHFGNGWTLRLPATEEGFEVLIP
jgi:hypothetical protein